MSLATAGGERAQERQCAVIKGPSSALRCGAGNTLYIAERGEDSFALGLCKAFGLHKGCSKGCSVWRAWLTAAAAKPLHLIIELCWTCRQEISAHFLCCQPDSMPWTHLYAPHFPFHECQLPRLQPAEPVAWLTSVWLFGLLLCSPRPHC